MKKAKTRKLILDIAKYLLFLAAGILLFLWVYRGQNAGEILDGLARFKYGWILASLVLLVFSHMFRALRWRMLIESLGYKPRVLNTFLAILIMYLANYAFPRMGEVTRCGILKKYDGVPFTSQLGTVLIERIVDALFLVLILGIVLLADWNVLAGFFHPAESGYQRKEIPLPGLSILIAAAGVVGILAIIMVLFWKRLKDKKFVKNIVELVRKFADGMRSLFRLKNPLLFILLTIGIYGCYYLMTWFVMLAFGPTSMVSPMVALAVLAMGSVGMVLPVQGGIGTYHFFAVETLALFGTARPDAQLLVFVLYGSTTLFIILIGAVALALLPLVNRKPAV